MVTLPTAEQIGYKIPSQAGGIVSIPQDPSRGALSGLGEGLQQVGEGLYQQQQAEQRKINALQQAKAETMFLQKSNEFVQSLSERGDYENFDKEYESFNKGISTQAAGMIPDPYERELFQANLARSSIGTSSKVQALKKDKWHNAELAGYLQWQDKASKTTGFGDIPVALLTNQKMTDALFQNGIMTAQQKYTADQNFSDAMILNGVQNLPVSEQARIASGQADTRSISIIDLVHDIEGSNNGQGGYVADDAGAGPTIFGINSTANPHAYSKIKELWDKGDVEGARSAADETYKTEYWDEMDGDKLPPEMQAVAMDTAVNMGVGTARELIEKSNGNPIRFTQLRKQEYKKIAERNPSKAKFLNTWIERSDRVLKSTEEGGILYNLSLDGRTKLKQEVSKNIATENLRQTLEATTDPNATNSLGNIAQSKAYIHRQLKQPGLDRHTINALSSQYKSLLSQEKTLNAAIEQQQEEKKATLFLGVNNGSVDPSEAIVQSGEFDAKRELAIYDHAVAKQKATIKEDAAAQKTIQDKNFQAINRKVYTGNYMPNENHLNDMVKEGLLAPEQATAIQEMGRTQEIRFDKKVTKEQQDSADTALLRMNKGELSPEQVKEASANFDASLRLSTYLAATSFEQKKMASDEKATKQAQQSTFDYLNNEADKGNLMPHYIETALKDESIDPAQAKQLRETIRSQGKRFKADLTSELTRKVANANTVESMIDVKRELFAESESGNIGGGAFQTLIDRIDSKAVKADDEAIKAYKEVMNRRMIDQDPNVSRETLKNDYLSGFKGLSYKDYQEVDNNFQSINKERLERERLQAAFKDPYNPEHKSAVDKLAPQLMSDASLQPEQKIAGMTDYVSKANGVIPASYAQALSVSLKSDDDKQKALAGDLYREFVASGADVSTLPKPTRAYGEMYSQFLNAGQQPVDAARNAAYTQDPSVAKVRGDQWNQIVSDVKKDDEDIFDRYGARDDSWIGIPFVDFERGNVFNDLPRTDAAFSTLRNEFEKSMEGYFKLTGDADVAQKMTIDDMGKVWDYVDTDDRGSVLQKYPPNKVFKMESSDVKEWLSDVKENLVSKSPGLADTEFTLIFDEGSQKSGNPRYLIIQDGLTPLRDKEGNLIEFNRVKANELRQFIGKDLIRRERASPSQDIYFPRG